MTINHRIDGSLDLMVSQPGGTFVTLLATDSHTSRKTEDRQEAVEYVHTSFSTPQPIIYCRHAACLVIRPSAHHY